MARQKALQLNRYYHVYHRGNNREPIFFEERNYRFFLEKYITYIEPVAVTHAYCLMNNHFHVCIRTKTEDEQRAHFIASLALEKTSEVDVPFTPLAPSQQFSNFFNSYAKAINKAYKRTGSLFENKFGRRLVKSESHLYNLIVYIHRNPQTHKFVDSFRDWRWSSYDAIFSDKPTRVDRNGVLNWFGDRREFMTSHQNDADEKAISYLIEDDL